LVISAKLATYSVGKTSFIFKGIFEKVDKLGKKLKEK